VENVKDSLIPSSETKKFSLHGLRTNSAFGINLTESNLLILYSMKSIINKFIHGIHGNFSLEVTVLDKHVLKITGCSSHAYI
jgi:hypothetical protein